MDNLDKTLLRASRTATYIDEGPVVADWERSQRPREYPDGEKTNAMLDENPHDAKQPNHEDNLGLELIYVSPSET